MTRRRSPDCVPAIGLAFISSLGPQGRWEGTQDSAVLAGSASFLLIAALTLYGFDYYRLPIEQRPFSPKHKILSPGGSIGLNLGILGTVLFCVIFLYAVRKVVPCLGRIGTAKHWMDFHVIAGVSAPIIIAFHASFKFNNIAGVTFWIMVAVALSGIGGRYLYSQIPRSLSAAELSYKEPEAGEDQLAEALRQHFLYTPDSLVRIFSMPSAEHVRKSWALVAIGEMILLDLHRPFQIAALRRKSSTFAAGVRSLGGFISSGNPRVGEHCDTGSPKGITLQAHPLS